MASGPISNTELDATIDQVWDRKIEDARYDNGVLLNRVISKSALVKNSGDKVELTYKPKFTTQSVTVATGAFTAQTFTPVSTELELTRWDSVPIEIVKRSQWQSFYDPESDIPTEGGKALAELYDATLGALYASFTSNIVGGDGSVANVFDDKMSLTAMLKLVKRSIPKDALSWVLSPACLYAGILTKPEYRDANKTGYPKSVLTAGFEKMELLGVPVYSSNQLTTVGQCKANFLMHTTGMAAAFNKKNDIERGSAVGNGKLSKVVVLSSAWNGKVWREDHTCLIYAGNF